MRCETRFAIDQTAHLGTVFDLDYTETGLDSVEGLFAGGQLEIVPAPVVPVAVGTAQNFVPVFVMAYRETDYGQGSRVDPDFQNRPAHYQIGNR